MEFVDLELNLSQRALNLMSRLYRQRRRGSIRKALEVQPLAAIGKF